MEGSEVLWSSPGTREQKKSGANQTVNTMNLIELAGVITVDIEHGYDEWG